MKISKFFLALLTLALFPIGAKAQSVAPAQPVQFAELGDFKLQSGGVIHDCRIGYRTLGNLNAARSNAILWPTWLGGRTDDLLQYVGPRNVADTDKYFVILVESIGNGVSSSPSNSESQHWMKFPEFSIQDMVESEYRLVTEKLGLTHLYGVMGISMGGMQTFAWVVTHPDFISVAIPIMGSPQSTAYDKLLWTTEIDAIELDPAWNGGNPTQPLTRGAAVSQEIDSMNVTSPAYRVARTAPEAAGDFIAQIRKSSPTDGGGAANEIRQRQAIIALDLPKQLRASFAGTAKRVRAKMLVILSPEDHMVNPTPAGRFAKSIGAPVIALDSPCGHISMGCISIGPIVAQFLANPSSVNSQTLHDPGKH